MKEFHRHVVMPSIFASLGRAPSASSLLALLKAAPRVDAHVASHAIYCLARVQTHDASDDFEAVRLVRRVAERAELSSRELSKAAWGLAKLWSGYSHAHDAIRHALRSLASQAADVADSLDAQVVASMLHAFATVGITPTFATMRALQHRAAALASAGALAPQDVANTLWALAKLRYEHYHLIDRVLARIAYD